jgi:hypothetical protein
MRVNFCIVASNDRTQLQHYRKQLFSITINGQTIQVLRRLDSNFVSQANAIEEKEAYQDERNRFATS